MYAYVCVCVCVCRSAQPSPSSHMDCFSFNRLKMTTILDANVHNIAVDGAFDDCQSMVKVCQHITRKASIDVCVCARVCVCVRVCACMCC